MHFRRCALTALAVAVTSFAQTNPAASQDVHEHTLGDPITTFPDGFGAVRGVRELPDGRVLVSDGLGKAVVVWDLAGGADTIGGIGGGPAEYQLPDGLWALPDGKTLLVDLGNGRLTELGADLSFGETTPIAQAPPGDSESQSPQAIQQRMRQTSFVLPRGVDREGRVYFQDMGMGMTDSIAVKRFDRETGQTEAVGRIKGPELKRTESGGAGNHNVQIQQVPLSPQDAWGVAWDGRVAIVRADDYRLEWVLPDGQVVRGQPVAYRPLPIRTADKEEWVEDLATNGLSVGVSIDNGRRQTSFSRGGRGGGSAIDSYAWPETKPAFRSSGVRVSRAGDAWVERHVPAGEARAFDVFGADGNLKARVRLPEDRELVAFGDGTVYLIRMDEFDFNWLERYELPSL
jgi:hypothetical protein